jgi:nitrate/TMAO reductase-like tetraheme cytochrome c subunit
MDNIKKAIMFAVGILITVGIIAMGLSFYGKANNMTKSADTSLNDITQTISNSKYTEYDGTTVSGTQAINAIRLYADNNFTVSVSTKKTTTSYNSATSYNITDISKSDYIEPTGKFKSKLEKTDNDTVNKIKLTQE